MKRIVNRLIGICGLTTLPFITIYFPLAGLFKYNFGIYGFNAIGVCVFIGILLLCMTYTDHLDWGLKKNEKKDEMSEEDRVLINKLERNPDLLNKVMVELRKRKLNKIKQKIT